MSSSNILEKPILKQLLLRDANTVQELTRVFELRPSTTSNVMNELIARGVVERTLPATSGRGRPQAVFQTRLPHPVAVAIVDGTEISAGLVDSDLQVLRSKRETGEFTDAEQITRTTLALLDDVIGDIEAGVTLFVNAMQLGDQTVTSSVLPNITSTVGRLIEQSTRDIRVNLNLRPELFAEYRQLEKPKPSPLLIYRAGDGVSAGLMANGKAIRGAGSMAGEIGHVQAAPDGPLCGCGRPGCLEALVSGPAIRRRMLEGLAAGAMSTLDAGLLESTSAREVTNLLWEAWHEGDSFVRYQMEDVFDKLAWGLSLMLNLFDPETVVFSGYVLKQRDAWIQEVVRRAERWTLHAGKRPTQFQSACASEAELFRVTAHSFFFEDMM